MTGRSLRNDRPMSPLQQRAPVIGVAIIGAVPDEMSFAVVVAWKGEEERRTIETVLFAKLCKLFRSRLFAKHGDCRIAGHKLDQECDERDDGPNNQQQNQQSSQDAEDPVPKVGSHSGA